MIVKRILHVVSSMNRGGAETMIMNLYRNIDRNEVQFDFISHIKEEADYDGEIKRLGGRIIKIESLGRSGPIKYIENLKRVMKKYGPFEAVHSHTNKQSGFVQIAAKLAGIDKRITHSHATSWKKRDKLLQYIMKIMSTKFCACGIDAGINSFGKKAYKSGKVYILNNGIELEKFSEIQEEKVLDLKRDLKLEGDALVIGHIGRFSEEKNHFFILKLSKYLREKKKKFVVLMLGRGPLKEEVKKKIKEMKLEKYVKILGVREDVNVVMNVIDVFILPSLYEGFPVVLVEAQAAGKRCLISNNISLEVDLGLGLVERLEIGINPLEDWLNKLYSEKNVILDKKNNIKILENLGFSARVNVKKLYKIYEI